MIKKGVFIILFGMISFQLFSQKNSEGATADPFRQYIELSENSMFRNLLWNSIGPKSIGGHIRG